jgi:4'-phosphopantetheinyl transferase
VLLRRVLGEYLDRQPSSLTFTCSERGKPSLEGQGVRFNLSHSGDLAVCAVTTVAEIGVDIEHIRPVEDIERLFMTISSVREFSAFQVLPAQEKLRAFFDAWTVKEACVKATGAGLATPLAEIEVLSAAGGERSITAGSESWSVLRFSPHPACAGAVALATRQDYAIRAIVRQYHVGEARA